MTTEILARSESIFPRRHVKARTARPAYAPQATMQENDVQFMLRVPIDQIDPAALRVAMHAGVLCITGKDAEGKRPFRRSFALPVPVAEDSLLVHLDTQNLTVTVNKCEAFGSHP